MRGASSAAGSTPYLLAERRHELDSSAIPGAGAAPSATEWASSACCAKARVKVAEHSDLSIRPPGRGLVLGSCRVSQCDSWYTGAAGRQICSLGRRGQLPPFVVET